MSVTSYWCWTEVYIISDIVRLLLWVIKSIIDFLLTITEAEAEWLEIFYEECLNEEYLNDVVCSELTN